MTELPGVSVVMPVLNEVKHLEAAVDAILEQTYPATCEVVLALGPSTDGTEALAHRLAAANPRVRIVDNPSGRTPTGLNAALAATGQPVVVRVDARSVIPPGYVQRAVQTMERTGADNVGGIMAAEGTTPFERAVACAMTSPFGVGGARFHTGGDEGPAESVYLGAFRRSTLDRLGGYDEHFVRAQDWELNHRIRESGGLVWFDPELSVTYRPRPDVRRLARQYRDYGRWRRVVARTHKGTTNLRYLAPPVTLLAVVVGLVAGVVGAVLGVPWLLLGFAMPAGYAAAVVLATLTRPRSLDGRARLWLLVVFPTMHGSWGWGFLTSRRRLLPGSLD